MTDVEAWIKERRVAQRRSSGEHWWEESGFPDPDDDRRELHAVMVNESDYAIAGICYVNRADATAIVDAHNTLPTALCALEKVLELHTRIVTDKHIDGPTAVCEQCSEDRLFALWPCETVEAIEGAINE